MTYIYYFGLYSAQEKECNFGNCFLGSIDEDMQRPIQSPVVEQESNLRSELSKLVL